MKTVLILDSNPVVRLTLGGLLKSHSGLLKVETANSPRKAVEIIDNQEIHMVIAGPGMAEIEDFELMAQLETQHSGIRLIIMTNKASPMLRTKIKQLPTIIKFDQLADTSLLMMRIYTELNIDYGGLIRGIQLPSFLQMMELEERTCTLHISTKGRIGQFYISKGVPIGARIGPLSGKQAALNMLTWENVQIEIDYTPVEMQPDINKPLISLIMESGRLVDDRHRKHPNQRKDHRFYCLVAMDYDMSDWTYQCVIKDLSLGGAYIETEQTIKVGQKIILTLTPPDLERGCTINATVIRNDHMGLAVRFETLSETQKEVIQFLSATKAAGPSGPVSYD